MVFNNCTVYLVISYTLYLEILELFVFVLFDYLCPSQQFKLCRDGSYRVELVLSKNQCVLLKDTTQ